MRKAFAALAVLLIPLTVLSQAVALGTAGAAQSGQGVTPSTITVGITYPDVAAIRNLINVDPGDYRRPTPPSSIRSTPPAGSTVARSCPSSPPSTLWGRRPRPPRAPS